MIGDDEQARRDEAELLAAFGADGDGDGNGNGDGMAGVPDPGPEYWAAFPSRVRARLAPRARRNEWLSAPRLALAASLALVVAVAALVVPGDVPRDADGESYDPLLAAFAPAPIDEWESLSGLTTAELEAMEERLLAPATPRARIDDLAAPLDDALEGIETLSDDRFDELLKRLAAMKT